MEVPEIELSIMLPVDEKKLFEIIDKKGLKVVHKDELLYVSNGEVKALVTNWIGSIEIKIYGECSDEHDKPVDVKTVRKALEGFTDIATKLYEGWLECH